jgi:hypothetical protein
MKKGANIVLEDIDSIRVDIRKRDPRTRINGREEKWYDQIFGVTLKKGKSWFWSARERMKCKLTVLYGTRANTRTDQSSFKSKCS